RLVIAGRGGRCVVADRSHLHDRPPPAAPPLPALVGNSLQEARAQVGLGAQPRNRAPRLERRFLHRVLAIVWVLQRPVSKARGGRDQRRHEIGERLVPLSPRKRSQRRHSNLFNALRQHSVAIPRLKILWSRVDGARNTSCDPHQTKPLTTAQPTI